MKNMSRRSFLQKGSLAVGAAGVAAAAPGVLRAGRSAVHADKGSGAAAAAVPARAEIATVEPSRIDTPVVARVRDARTGEIDLFVGQRRVTIHDRETASRLINAAR
jgi:3-hydroxyisobutyrate dehydrogenase-like beta-hydroxyacid dehydrogenase